MVEGAKNSLIDLYSHPEYLDPLPIETEGSFYGHREETSDPP